MGYSLNSKLLSPWHNYYPDLVWKIDNVLLAIILLLSFFIFLYLIDQEISVQLYRQRLIAIKNHIYELLLSKADRNTCPTDTATITSKEFLDIVTNRNTQAAFFNQQEQDYIRHCFINQNNILKIERIARKAKNKWRRIEAISALSFTQASGALALFEKGLFDKDLDVSYFSLLALGRVKTDLSLKILLAFLKKDFKSRSKVAAVVETFPDSAVQEIIKLLEDRDPEIRFWGLKILARFKPVSDIDKIKALSLDQYPKVRAVACEYLSNIAGKGTEDDLIRFLKDDSWLVRAHAVNALSKARGKDSVKYIVELLSDNSLNVIGIVKEVLIRNIDAALPYLEKILVNSKDVLAKKISVEILATSGYTEKIIRNAALKEDCLDPGEMNLFAALVNSGAQSSIEAVFLVLSAQEQSHVLAKLRQVNATFAEDLARKIKGAVKEI